MTKKSEWTANKQQAQDSSTETDIHPDSNDLRTKEAEVTVNMQTAQESSTERGKCHDSIDLKCRF